MSNLKKITATNFGPGKGNDRFVAYSKQVNAIIDEVNDGNYGVNATITAATGSTQATGVLLDEEYNIISTCGTAGDSVTLPVPAKAGMRRVVINTGVNAADVFPASGASINDLSADAAISLLPEQAIEFISTSKTAWQSTDEGTTTAVTVTPNSGAEAASLIPAGATKVDVAAVTNDADDFIVLPSVALVPVGHQIIIACNAGGNFELRTPASSAEEINGVDCDGTQEYLCVDTEVVVVTKVSDTDDWVAYDIPALGGVGTATVPD
jgi:hypothetical protein